LQRRFASLVEACGPTGVTTDVLVVREEDGVVEERWCPFGRPRTDVVTAGQALVLLFV
jgi:hypothetical protein